MVATPRCRSVMQVHSVDASLGVDCKLKIQTADHTKKLSNSVLEEH